MPSTRSTAPGSCSRSGGSTRRGRRSTGRWRATPTRAWPMPSARSSSWCRTEDADALASAQRAVELSPQSAAAKIALSYAQQGNFQLEGARETLLQATEQQPNDALAWARLAELWMMFGYLDRARTAAERAVELAPGGRAHPDRARLRQSGRVPHRAGQGGLRAGDRARSRRPAGRASASASPRSATAIWRRGARTSRSRSAWTANDALLRAYLGKAYFDGEAQRVANEQYHIAQELDPLDPTAYLYEAIKQQTEGRPGEALENIQKSIELNDNRAVYRSRLLLDSDRAARGTSLALVYDDLGFLQPGVNEATEVADPRSDQRRRPSLPLGHLPRRAPARDRAGQQPAPGADAAGHQHQPGAAEPERGQPQHRHPGRPGGGGLQRVHAPVRAQSGAAERHRRGGQREHLSAARASPRCSTAAIRSSAGGFGYTTDGWRKNNDIDQDVEDFFFQTAITPELNAQAEFRRRHSNPAISRSTSIPILLQQLRTEIDQDTYRAGLRYSPLPSSDFLLSFIYSDLKKDEFNDSFRSTGSRPGPDSKDKGTQTEGQYLFPAGPLQPHGRRRATATSTENAEL